MHDSFDKTCVQKIAKYDQWKIAAYKLSRADPKNLRIQKVSK